MAADRLSRQQAVRVAIRPENLRLSADSGGGAATGAVPRQVAGFLNLPQNRALLRGVIASGNTNFGADFCLAGTLISRKCAVPVLYRFELLGTEHDVLAVERGLDAFWAGQPDRRVA